MKTILVLTDFSLKADDAAHYALKLAQRIKANLLLCNIYTVPSAEKTDQRQKWPLQQQEENSSNDLGALMAHLKTEMDKPESQMDFRPEINQYSKEGLVAERINEIAKTYQVLMAVISMHSASYLTTLLAGNHESAIIEKANFPILVIPYQVRFSAYKTIAFATNMNCTDINLLQCLSGLAKHTDAGILIAHVADEVSDAPQQEKDMKQFFNQIPSKITYPKIIYRVIKSSNVAQSIKSLTEDVEVDLLVLVHRRRNFFQKIFGGSITQNIANRPVKPLLIFPSSKVLEILPVF